MCNFFSLISTGLGQPSRKATTNEPFSMGSSVCQSMKSSPLVYMEMCAWFALRPTCLHRFENKLDVTGKKSEGVVAYATALE